MSNKKQTTVDCLIEKLQNRQNAIFNGFPHLYLYEIFKQAKELEKQQIKESYESGEFDCGSNGTSEDYYNNTYQK